VETSAPDPDLNKAPLWKRLLPIVIGVGVMVFLFGWVFVYRILTWLTPIPFGGLAFTRWRDEVRATGKTELLDAFDDSDAAPEGA
jgi:hypothetical protein